MVNRKNISRSLKRNVFRIRLEMKEVYLGQCFILLSFVMELCWGHARLVDPPSRASAWRFGWGTPVDYNDNEGFCGGFSHQYFTQDGRCGLCGDAWDEDPRPHEVGGKYATGTIVREYTEGQVIPVRVEVTSNHRGHFEFRICPNNNPQVEATQTCLNEYPLFQADGSGFQHEIREGNGIHQVHLRLPSGLTCTQCVFQWRYVAANNWGICDSGIGGLGCGPQEEFRACADVAVLSQPTWSSDGFTNTTASPTVSVVVPTETSTTKQPSSTTTKLPLQTSTTTKVPVHTTTTTITTKRPIPTTTSPEGSGGCHAVGVWATIAGMDDWCERNCNHVSPFCPASHCTCT